MNTIKFTSIHKTATERHNPNNESSIDAHIFGENIKLLNPTNLNIMIHQKCNCKCSFCIADQSDQRCAVSDEMYLSILESTFKELQNLPIEITITGGEPTLFPKRLIKVMDLISKYNFGYRTFATNGYNLLDQIDNKCLLQHMKEHNAIYNINLSRMHMNTTVNEKLMNGIGPSIKNMHQIGSFCEVNNMDIRLSCNLMKSGISTLEDIIQYLNFAKNLKYDNVIFRELVGYEKEYIDITPIMTEIIKNEHRFHYIESVFSNHYIIDIFKFDSYIVKLYTDKTYHNASDNTILSSLVYREGVLSTSWDNKKIFEVKK